MFKKLLDFIFPPRCLVCDEVIATSKRICNHCILEKSSYIKAQKRCFNCGKFLDSCICKHHQLYFKASTAPFEYDEQVKGAILSLKNQNSEILIRELAVAMAKFVEEDFLQVEFNGVMSVPTSEERLAEKGYNHAEVLAMGVAKALNLPYIAIPIYRINTPQQHSLSLFDRTKSVFESYFLADNAVSRGNILLVDDVMTTGSTLNRCSQLLKQCGAENIYCVTASTTMLNYEKADED